MREPAADRCLFIGQSLDKEDWGCDLVGVQVVDKRDGRLVFFRGKGKAYDHVIIAMVITAIAHLPDPVDPNKTTAHIFLVL